MSHGGSPPAQMAHLKGLGRAFGAIVDELSRWLQEWDCVLIGKGPICVDERVAGYTEYDVRDREEVPDDEGWEVVSREILGKIRARAWPSSAP